MFACVVVDADVFDFYLFFSLSLFFFFPLPPQLWEATILNQGTECTWHAQSNSDQMLKSPPLLKYSPPTTPSLPPLHRIHCYSASDPNQWLWGGKVRTLTLTPDSPNTWDFALKKRRIRVFQNDMHTQLHPECAAKPVFCVCVSTWVTHTVNSLCFLWLSLRCVLQGGQSEGALCLCVLVILVSSHGADPTSKFCWKPPAGSMSETSHPRS